jgi:hypothetical protein
VQVAGSVMKVKNGKRELDTQKKEYRTLFCELKGVCV